MGEHDYIGKKCGQCIHSKNCKEKWGQIAGDNVKACPDFEEFIRVLAVRQPWASLIVEGLKTIEVRPRNTNIRGPVAIYAGKPVPSSAEEEHFMRSIFILQRNGAITNRERDFLANHFHKSARGCIIGTVIIEDTHKVTETSYQKHENEHMAPDKYFEPGRTFFWHLKNPVKFAEPVKLPKWPSGGPWALIPKSVLSGHQKSEMEDAVSEKRM